MKLGLAALLALAVLFSSQVAVLANEIPSEAGGGEKHEKKESLLGDGAKYSWLKSNMEGLNTEMFIFKSFTKESAKEIQEKGMVEKRELLTQSKLEYDGLQGTQSVIINDFLQCPATDRDIILDDCQEFLNTVISKYYPTVLEEKYFEFGYWSQDMCKNLLIKEANIHKNLLDIAVEEGKNVEDRECKYTDHDFITITLKTWRAFKLSNRRQADIELNTVHNQYVLILEELKNCVNAMEYLCHEYGLETNCGVFPSYNKTMTNEFCTAFEPAFTGVYYEDLEFAAKLKHPDEKKISDSEAMNTMFIDADDDEDDENEEHEGEKTTTRSPSELRALEEAERTNLKNCDKTNAQLVKETTKYTVAMKTVGEKYSKIFHKKQDMEVTESLLRPAMDKYDHELNALSEALGFPTL